MGLNNLDVLNIGRSRNHWDYPQLVAHGQHTMLMHFPKLSFLSKTLPWCMGWYVLSRSFVVPHFKAPSTHPFDKNGPNFFVNLSKFGPRPQKVSFKMEMDASRVHPIAEILTKSYWIFSFNLFNSTKTSTTRWSMNWNWKVVTC